MLEYEQLFKISYADSGTTADIRANLDETLDWVRRQNEENLAIARAYLTGEGAFSGRATLNQLAGRFLTDFYLTVARWAEWASELVEGWPDDPRSASGDRGVLEETVRRAESVAALAEASGAPGREGPAGAAGDP